MNSLKLLKELIKFKTVLSGGNTTNLVFSLNNNSVELLVCSRGKEICNLKEFYDEIK
jgi:hypothetical protein